MSVKEKAPWLYQLARQAYYASLKNRFRRLSEQEYPDALKKLYYKKTGLQLDLENPERFTEKIQYRKLYDRNELYSLLSDKYYVKEWVSKKIGSQYVVKTIGCWTSFDEIDFSQFPNQFVLKTTNATGTNIIVRDKKEFKISQTRKKVNRWMKQSFGIETGFELQYLTIDKKIIAEEYLNGLDGNLFDYKVHCFHGEPMFIQLIGDRDYTKHTGKQIIMGFDWKEKSWCFDDYPKYDSPIEKPHNLEEIYRISKQLSADFDYVRVDLYDVNNKILFGEMTFTPGSGFYRPVHNWSIETDLMIGSMW